MISNDFHEGEPLPGCDPSSAGETRSIPEVVRHLALALSGHVRHLHQEGLPVPREVEELTHFLVQLARSRQEPPQPAGAGETMQYTRMPDRLLVTKAEAAERLGVSVRTIERLVAIGRLPQVHVERLARFRVRDLEAFVESLAEPVLDPDASSKLPRA